MLFQNRWIRLAALVAAFALVAAACSSDEGDGETSTTAGSTETTEGTAGGELEEVIWALPFLPDTLFVPAEWTTTQGAVVSLSQEGLLAFDDDLKLIPALAESWEQVDELTYVYTLREGATFQDGTPVTADDVVASLLWHLNPDNVSFVDIFFFSVDTIEATGEREITVTLLSPDATWQYTPALMAGFILPASQLEGDTELLGSPDLIPIGTGPYAITEFIPGDRVVLERYDGYWGENGPAKRIVIIQIDDDQTRLLAMRDGDIDGTFEVPETEIDQWQGLDNVDVVTTSALGLVVITLDYDTPPFDDLHVRKAIAHSLDQDGLISAILKGQGEKGITVNPPDSWTPVISGDEARAFYDTLPQYEFDMEKAAGELAQSSVPDGFEFTVQIPGGAPLMLNPVLSLAENLSTIGITMTVEEVDDATWADGYFNPEGNLGMQVMQYSADYVDPVNYPSLFLWGAQAGGGFNASNYVDERVDELIDIAFAESDPAAREAALKELHQIAQEDVAVIPVYYLDAVMAIRSDLKLDGFNGFWYNIPWAIRGFGPK
jgi:peptide/nickel transport system substrate-binding protein